MVIRAFSPDPSSNFAMEKKKEQLFPESEELVSEATFQNLSNEIRRCFPTFVASVFADQNGFVIHADGADQMDENLLALSAICKKRKILDLSEYHKISRPLNKNVQLMVLLNKSRENYLKFGQFEKMLAEKNPV